MGVQTLLEGPPPMEKTGLLAHANSTAGMLLKSEKSSDRKEVCKQIGSKGDVENHPSWESMVENPLKLRAGATLKKLA